MHTPRHAFSMCVHSDSGDVYVTGGWTHGSRCIGTCERLVFGNNIWEVCTPMIMPRRLHGSAMSGSTLYVFGGSPGSEVEQKLRTNCVESYDCTTFKWTLCAPMPYKAHVVATSVNDQQVYVFPYGDEEMLCYSPMTDTYVTLGKLPLPSWHGYAVTHNSKFDPTGVYLVGGATNGKWSKKIFRYDVVLVKWKELPELSLPRRRLGCAIGMST